MVNLEHRSEQNGAELISNDVIHVTPTPVAILVVTLVTTAMLTMKLQTCVSTLYIYKNLKFGPVQRR